jgi:hypothetical protein
MPLYVKEILICPSENPSSFLAESFAKRLARNSAFDDADRPAVNMQPSHGVSR